MRPIFLIPLLALVILPARAGHKEVTTVFLRVHVQTSGEGLPATEATSLSIPPDGDLIQVRTFPEATERELIDVKTDPSGKVQLFFNHQGQINISAATAQNDGRILVILINGVVVYAPVIDEQITSGELDIPHPINPKVVQLLLETAQRNVLEEARK